MPKKHYWNYRILTRIVTPQNPLIGIGGNFLLQKYIIKMESHHLIRIQIVIHYRGGML